MQYLVVSESTGVWTEHKRQQEELPMSKSRTIWKREEKGKKKQEKKKEKKRNFFMKWNIWGILILKVYSLLI